MGYGIGIALVAIGLILALAVQDAVPGVDLTMVGWICTGVGIVALVLAAVTMNNNRRRTDVVETRREV